MCKLQGAEIEDAGSVLKYMTKSKIEKLRSSLRIMTQRHVVACKMTYRSTFLDLCHSSEF